MNQSLQSTKADKLKRGKSLKRLEEKFLVFLKIKEDSKTKPQNLKKANANLTQRYNMSLLSKEQIKDIPNLYETESIKDPKVYLKITCLDSTWLITELNKEDNLAFGFCEVQKGLGELGYVSIQEIEDLQRYYPIQVEMVDMKLSQGKKELGY